MRTSTGTIDWKATEEEAKRLTEFQLLSAIYDCLGTIEVFEPEDRANGFRVNRSAYYYDCISVYRQELLNRKKGAQK